MAQGDAKKKKDKKPVVDKNFTDTVKIMANTPPISNEEIVKHSKKRKK